MLGVLRRSRGWSQTILSVASGVSQPEISRIERGTIHRPRPETVERLAQALGIPAIALMQGADEIGAGGEHGDD